MELKIRTRRRIANFKNLLGIKLSNKAGSSDYFNKKKKKRRSKK